MSITATQRAEIVKIVVGLFNAAPGAVYLDGLAAAYGSNTTALINDLTVDPAFLSLYPASLSNLDFATQYVDSLVGNAAAAEDKAWAAQWIADMLDAGSSRAEVMTTAVTELQAAADHPKWSAAAAQFANKVKAAEYYSEQMAGNATDIGVLQKAIFDVTDTTDVSNAGALEQLIQTSLKQTFTLKEIRTVEKLEDTYPTQKVAYWGNPATGKGVPAELLWGQMSAYLSTQVKDQLFDIVDSLEEIKNITIEGVKDGADTFTSTTENKTENKTDQSIETAVQTNTDTTADTTTNTTNDTVISGGDGQGGYTGNYEITVTLSDGTINTAVIELTQAQFDYLNGLLFDANGNSRLFEKDVAYMVDTGLVDANGDKILVPAVIEGETVITDTPIVLTPEINNGGTEEVGKSDGLNDTVVAARLELLHGAYIDGGAGENTLEVDAKGHFAQPKALLNIQHIQVQNLPNVYTSVDGSGYTYNPDTSPANSGDVYNGYPDVVEGGVSPNQDSILDISRAVDIETLTVTEGNFEGLNGQQTVGSLTIAGIRNGVTTTLDGGFTQNVTLHYGEMQGAGVDLVFNNLSMGDTESDWYNTVSQQGDTESGWYNYGPQLNVAHNAEELTITTTGGDSYLANGYLGGKLKQLTIKGDQHLHIEGDLDYSFHDETPVTIDASANTGGVDLKLSDSEQVTFLGSQANDRFQVSTSEASGMVGAGEYENRVTITDLNGDNHFEVASDNISVTVGDGNNNIELTGVNAVVVAGNGNNTVAAEDIVAVNFILGAGNNVVSAFASKSIVVTTGAGNNVITAEAADIAITTDAGNDTIVVAGIDDDYTDHVSHGEELGAKIVIDTGAGENTVQLGFESKPESQGASTYGGLIAKEGSSITGENITLVVKTEADLRAATLDGITAIILDDDNSSYSSSVTANEEVVERAVLTLLDTQVAQLAADGVSISVEGAIFHTSAHIKIIVTENLDVTTGAWADWLDSLPVNVDLQFEINDGAQLTISAEQLHTKVDAQGITIANDGNTDQVSGKVLITGAGLDFDPFNNSDQIRTDIDGRKYIGGSLSSDVDFGFVVEGADVDDGVQRDEWGFNVLVDRVVNGYDRPADAKSYSRLVIDTDEQNGQIGPFETIETFLRIVGEADMAFTPVQGGIDDWGREIEGGTAIALGVDNGQPTNGFMVDFSSATGTISNLTLAHFQMADAVYGNGTAEAPVRINVEIDEGQSVASETAGLVSRDVQTYVVTNIGEGDAEGEGAHSAWFWTSRVTEDLQTLGLRGNYEDTITFGNTERGVDFLMEVAYDKFDGYAVGSLVADFARPGAAAVVNVVGLSPLPAGEVQKVAGIDVTDAASATINVTGGNTVIESLASTDANGDGVDALTLSADANLTIDTVLMAGVDSVDASGVVGTLTLSIEDPAEGFTFVGAAGSTDLTIDGAADGAIASIAGAGEISLTIEAEVDLSATAVTNVTSVTLENGSKLVLTMEQADAIGAANFAVAEGDTAELVLQGLNDQEFALANYAVDGTLNISVTLAEVPEVILHPNTDLTGINELVIPEGTTLFLTMAQFQQLEGNGSLSGEGSVHITDVTQASVGEAGEDLDLDGVDLSGAESTLTLTLAESVDLSAADIYSNWNAAARVDVFNIGGFMLTLGDIQDANGVDVNGTAGSVLKFVDTESTADESIDASGFSVEQLMMLNVLVANRNIDQLFYGLQESVTKIVYNELGEVEGVVQSVVITEGTTVPGFAVFNRPEADAEIRYFNLTMEGGAEISGDLNLSASSLEDGLLQADLQTVTITSTGTAENAFSGNTANIIRGDITSKGTGLQSGYTSVDNDLLNVVIAADQDFVVVGDIVFESVVNNDLIVVNDDDAATATLSITGAANVTIQQLDITDGDIETLVVANNGTGMLTVTGASPAIVTTSAADQTQNLVLQGAGDMVFGDDDGATTNVSIDSTSLVSIDATGLSGDLNLGEIASVNAEAFSFKAGSGVNYIHLTGGNLDSTGDDPATTADDTAGWSFDYTGAAVGSQLVIDSSLGFVAGSKLAINMGANGVLLIDGVEGDTVDLSALDLDITSVQNIVLADGVELILTAEQASGLKIVAGPDAGAEGITALVNIVELGDTAVDLSGIAQNIAGTITLEDDDVTLDAGTNLGVADGFSVTLNDVDSTGTADELAGQTIRFATAAQAEREIIVDGADVGNAEQDTNVVWLFNTITGTATAGKVDTANYDENLGRLWVNDQLVNGVNVEALWTTLDQGIIVRVVNTADLTELLPFVNPFSRSVEVESFTQLPAGLIFSDEDLLGSLVNLTIDLGGDVNIGSLNLDNVLGPVRDPANAEFDTLRLNSMLADSADHYLLPESWDEDVNPLPTGANVIGNISGGAAHSLINVEINAADVAFRAQTITFTDDEAEVANLTVMGENNVTLKSLNTADADITGLVITNNLSGATLTVTGGSPAAAVANTESLTINSGTATTRLGTAQDTANGVPYAGVAGADLSEITINGSGTVNLGTLALIDGSDDDLNADGDLLDAGENVAFTLSAEDTAVVTARLGSGNVDGTVVAPTLAAESTWSFINVDNLTITEDVTFEADSNLILNNVNLTLDGEVDLSAVNLTLLGANQIEVPAGATFVVSVDQLKQADMVDIVGAGTVKVVGNADDVNTVGAHLKTVNVDLSAVTLTIADGALDAAGDEVLEVVLSGATVGADAGLAQTVVGSANNDDITLANGVDNTVTAGAGNDTIRLGAAGNNTINVDAGTDTLVGLNTGEVLVVSAGATVTAETAAFVATAATVNDGTANLSVAAGAADGATIDVSAATGANGFNLTGRADNAGTTKDVLIGSAKADVINGGNDAQIAGTQDALTGNGGADTFAFNVQVSTPVLPTIATPTAAVDAATITVTADGADENDETLTITYTLNGVASAIIIDNDPALNVADANAVAAAIASALSAVNGVTATAATNVVTVAGDNGSSFQLVGAAATVGGTTTALAAVYDNTAGDVAQQSTVGIDAAVVAGEVYKLNVTLKEGQVIGVEYTAVGGDTSANVAAGLVGAFNTVAAALTVNAVAAGGVITLDDENADNGGFSVSVAVDPAVSGTGASTLGAADLATADIITDFLSGTDKVQIDGMAAGTGTNYAEAAEVATYAAALTAANAALNGTVVYYLTSSAVADEEGLLFFDANADGTADGVIHLVGITADNFAATDIIAG